MAKMSLDIKSVHSKKTDKDYEVLSITIGEWEKNLFLTPFEIKYIKSVIDNVKD